MTRAQIAEYISSSFTSVDFDWRYYGSFAASVLTEIGIQIYSEDHIYIFKNYPIEDYVILNLQEVINFLKKEFKFKNFI